MSRRAVEVMRRDPAPSLVRSEAARPTPLLFPQDGGATACRIATLVLLFVALHTLLEWPVLDRPLLALNTATADAAIAWLAAAGVPLLREGTMVMHARGFVTEVHQVCTALLPAALLAAGIAMHPHGRPGQKAAGMLLGVAVVALVNQCRLAGVIWVGVQAPEFFSAVHGWLAPAWLLALTTGYGWAWTLTVRPKLSPSQPSLQP
jgi:exosortase/archaeosortase family protein